MFISLIAAAVAVIASLPNWKIEKAKDMLTDKISCTAYYKGRRDIQLSNDTLYVLTKFSPKGFVLRYGDDPPQAFRLATTEEKELRAIIIKIGGSGAPNPERLLAIHEEEKKKIRDEYDRRRDLYRQGLISRAELAETERALAAAIVRVDEDKLSMPNIPYLKFSETKRLRYQVMTILDTIVEGDLDLKDATKALALIRGEKCTQ